MARHGRLAAARIVVVLALAVVLAAEDDQGGEEAHQVFNNRDLLNEIMQRVPISERRFFNQDSRDLLRLHRFLDPDVSGRRWAEAVRDLNPPERYRDDLRAALNSWPVAVRITRQLLQLDRHRVRIDDLVVLARRLVSDLQLDRVGLLLPGMAVLARFPTPCVMRFVEVAAPVAAAPQLPREIVDLVSAAVDASLVQWLHGDFPEYDMSPDAVLAQWRLNTTSMSYAQVRSSLLRKLKQGSMTPALMSDVRLFYRTFILSFDSDLGGYPAHVRDAFERIFPDPINFISIDPAHISQYVLRHLSPSQRTDLTLLVSLRRVGVAFSVFDYMQQIRGSNPDLASVVPLLENWRALETIEALTEQDRVEHLAILTKIPQFVTELGDQEYKMCKFITKVIEDGKTAAFRTLATLEDVQFCFRCHLPNASVWGNLLHVAARYDRLEIAEILLKSRPELANDMDWGFLVPLRMVTDPNSRIYQLIEPYTNPEWRGQYPIPPRRTARSAA